MKKQVQPLFLLISFVLITLQPASGKEPVYHNHASLFGQVMPADDFKLVSYGLEGDIFTGKIKKLFFFSKVHLEQLRTDTNSDFEEVLYDIRYRLSMGPYSRKFGITLGAASPSDKPFNSMDEIKLSASFTYRFYQSQKHSWYAGVLISSRNVLISNYFPLPSVFYHYKGEKLNFFAGPALIHLHWQFSKPVSLTVNSVPFWEYRISLNYQVHKNVNTSLTMFRKERQFLISSREEDDDRLEFDQNAAGLETEINLSKKHWLISLFGGYSFAAKHFIWEDFGERRNTIDIDDTFTANIKIQYRF